ncbi:hypothetical protein TeGR_g11982 [Tetraparma gracilis]|uniref:Flavodoxin-like domain-containing protein n=1 Tax=Tetraparma gracilis TaxID=2962635 RepID=A0ABQ6MLJ1_9STRA|nr:hypothetical protein TeGR_g11982 [Tetraparma gracilis]
MFSILALALLPTAASFGLSPATFGVRAPTTALSAKVGLFYSTTTGNTETCGNHIAEAISGAGLSADELTDIADGDDFGSYDSIIAGAPTWHTGADSERSGTSWDSWLYDELPNLDLKGKKVAIFGCGDQQGYGDNYCDAAGELYDQFKAAGCEIVGMTSTEGYLHADSKAEVGGKFVGMMFDEDNQDDMSEERAKTWVAQLKGEGIF